jgi:hypothetical protein
MVPLGQYHADRALQADEQSADGIQRTPSPRLALSRAVFPMRAPACIGLFSPGFGSTRRSAWRSDMINNHRKTAMLYYTKKLRYHRANHRFFRRSIRA